MADVTKINGYNIKDAEARASKANDSAVVHLAGTETISGKKTVTSGLNVSGRWQDSGDDEGIVVGVASNGYAGICLGNPSGERVVLYNRTSDHSCILRHNNGSAGYDFVFPNKGGTVALTSDLPTTYTGW